MNEPSRSRSHDPNTIDIERNTIQTRIDDHIPPKENIDQHRKTLLRFPETDLSRGLVGWDVQDDPQMSLNFSSRQK